MARRVAGWRRRTRPARLPGLGDAAVLAVACRRAAVALFLCVVFCRERRGFPPRWRSDWARAAGLAAVAPRPRPRRAYDLGPFAPAFPCRRGGASLQRAAADIVCCRGFRAASGLDPGWA